ERSFHVRRQDGQTVIDFHPLKQIADLDVGITIVAVLDFTAFSKQSVGFVKKQNCSAFFRCVKYAAQILFRFADVLADDLAEVDAVKVQLQFIGEHLSRHRFSGAAGACKKRADSEP